MSAATCYMWWGPHQASRCGEWLVQLKSCRCTIAGVVEKQVLARTHDPPNNSYVCVLLEYFGVDRRWCPTDVYWLPPGMTLPPVLAATFISWVDYCWNSSQVDNRWLQVDEGIRESGEIHSSFMPVCLCISFERGHQLSTNVMTIT